MKAGTRYAGDLARAKKYYLYISGCHYTAFHGMGKRDLTVLKYDF